MNKIILFLTGLLLIVTGCGDKNEISIQDVSIANYTVFGEKVSSEHIYDQKMITQKYNDLKVGDTIDIVFMGVVNDVCKAKGCWMKINLEENKETMVRFKNYGFFVPKDSENDTVIVQGKAFVSEMSIEDQRHYADDAGKTEEEINAITKPQKTYSFIADGVLIKKR